MQYVEYNYMTKDINKILEKSTKYSLNFKKYSPILKEKKFPKAHKGESITCLLHMNSFLQSPKIDTGSLNHHILFILVLNLKNSLI